MEKLNKTYYVEVPASLNPGQLKMMMELEQDAFPGLGAVDEQALVPLTRYGKLIQYRQQNNLKADCDLRSDESLQ